MSGSIESVVSASIAMQGYTLAQDKNNLLLSKVLANQEQTIMSLLDAASVTPKAFGSGRQRGDTGTRDRLIA